MFSRIRKYLPYLAINLEAGDYLENFFVFVVFSIVAIRVFLAVTGYPQLGGRGLARSGELLSLDYFGISEYLDVQLFKIPSATGNSPQIYYRFSLVE